MTVNETLAAYSNDLVYAAMIVYAAAMVAFAASFAGGRDRSDASVRRGASGRGSSAAVAAVAGEAGGGVATAVRTRSSGDGGASAEFVAEPGRRAGNIGMSLTWLAGTLLLGGVVLRGLSAGRVPWGNMYEFSITSALGITAAFLIVSLRRDVRWLGLFVVVPVLLTLGLAVAVLYTESAQLVPALKSTWLVIHVLAAIIAGGGFTLGAAVTVLYLAVDRVERRIAAGLPAGRLAVIARRVPSSDRLDTLAYRIYAFVFPLWTFAVVAGAIWAESAWGRYWGWDPKETWAFITWVVYAGYLHARATAGWRGRRAAAIALVGFATFVANYFVVNLFATGLHSYSGV